MFLSENQIFWRNLEKIRKSLLYNDTEFALELGLDYDLFIKLRSKEKFLPLDCVFDFSEKMNIHFENLLEVNFNFKDHNNVNTPLMDRYSIAKHSHTRSIHNILNYLEITKGERAKLNLLRKFQLSEDFIADAKNKANILLITDILKYLAKNHAFTPGDFLAIGQRMPFLTSNQILKERLSSQRDALSMLECFIYECTRLFDSNCTYQILSASDQFAIIDVLPNKQVLEELKISINDFGNEAVCLTRMGNISSVTWFKYQQNMIVKKISSIHDGDVSNQYLFDLSHFNRLEKSLNPDQNISFGSLYQ